MDKPTSNDEVETVSAGDVSPVMIALAVIDLATDRWRIARSASIECPDHSEPD